jgi:hypothetical protein
MVTVRLVEEPVGLGPALSATGAKMILDRTCAREALVDDETPRGATESRCPG